MDVRSVEFAAPYDVRVTQSSLQWPQSGKALVKTIVSAISSGTELLAFRGQWPKGCVVDSTISSLSEDFSYPLKYGYSSVGRVIDVGTGVDKSLLGKRVFSFNPHESHFACNPNEVIQIPDDIEHDDAAILPNMETAVNFVMDGHPLIGERVCVFGLGIVGLLTTAVLSRTGLENLVAFDRIELRRNRALELGADFAIDPADAFDISENHFRGGTDSYSAWADLCYELTGSPQALNDAINATGFAGRIVIGSWYGSKKSDINLGGYFHRSRIRMISSQVSSIAPEFMGRWTKDRRMNLALSFLRKIRPSSLITHRFNVEDAPRAYELIDKRPSEVIQVILTYED